MSSSSRSRSATACATTPAAWTSTALPSGSRAPSTDPDSTTTVYRLEPGGSPEHAFDVDDHIGAMARCGPTATSSAGRGARAASTAGRSTGTCDAARVNPAFFVDHQDCQWLDSGSPPVRRRRRSRPVDRGPVGSAVSGCSTSTSWSMQREVPFPIYSSRRPAESRHTTRCGPRSATTS